MIYEKPVQTQKSRYRIFASLTRNQSLWAKNAAKRLKNGGKLGIILGNPREGYHDQQLFCQ